MPAAQVDDADRVAARADLIERLHAAFSPESGGKDQRSRFAIPQVPPLPWASIRHRLRHAVRPWLVAGGVVGGAALVDSYHTPAGWVAGGGAVATAAAYRLAPRFLIRPEVDDAGRKYRPRFADLRDAAAALVAARRRLAAYITATAAGWLTLADVTGLDPSTVGGRVAWTLAAAGFVGCSAPWWSYTRARPPAAETPEDAAGFGALIAARWVATVGAVARPERTVPPRVQGEPPEVIPAVLAGTLPGTVLEGVRRVAGGWAAVVVDPLQRGLDWVTDAVRRNIASAFGAGLAAVTLAPDADDACRCFVMVQKRSPLKDTVRWLGPDAGLDVARGTAIVGRYADGTDLRYEVYRPGFGSPHVFACGTTGAGKSELLNTLFVVERWFATPNDDGSMRGLVCSFLIDPQQGQSYEPFMDDLAAPPATTIEEALLLARALHREALRRNAYLSRRGWTDPQGNVWRAEWTDGKGRKRYGRKWWDPVADGPILSLTIDEAHDYLANREFSRLITSAGRMWRKCGMQVKVATHTPLLGDLGGSMALRDMLTGGFVFVGRTANSLSGPTAFNGRLPVDPRSIPEVPGMGYAMSALNPRAMLARTAWEPDYYDWVRDADDEPIGFPGVLPSETLAAFGPEFVKWRDTGEVTAAAEASRPEESDVRAADAVLEVLLAAADPLDINQLDTALEPHRAQGVKCSVRTARAELKKLKDAGDLEPLHGRFVLTPAAREQYAAMRAESAA